MIVHIALFKLKPSSDPADMEEMMKSIKGLKDKIPGIIDIRAGKNFSKWNENYTHAFLVLAENKEALEAYRTHADHTELSHGIDLMDAGGSIGIDFED